jgi:hypothetical protein
MRSNIGSGWWIEAKETPSNEQEQSSVLWNLIQNI